MPHSYSETTTFTCSHCDRDAEAAVWLVVDPAERPDLADRIRQGTLHTLTCPHCGGEVSVDAPLLVHDGARQRLFFAPPRHTTQAQDQQMARDLVQRLAQGFPEPPAYLGQVRALPASLMGVALDAEDPEALEAALRQALAQDPRGAAVQALLDADSPAQLLAAALEHPLLLSEEGLALVREGIDNARQAGQEDMARHVEERYETLRELHAAGVTPEKLSELGPGGDAETRRKGRNRE